MNANGLWRNVPNRPLLRFGTVRPRVQIPRPRPKSEFKSATRAPGNMTTLLSSVVVPRSVLVLFHHQAPLWAGCEGRRRIDRLRKRCGGQLSRELGRRRPCHAVGRRLENGVRARRDRLDEPWRGRHDARERVTIRPRQGEAHTAELPVVPRPGTWGTLTEFVRAIQTGRQPESSGRDDLGSMP